MLPFQANVSSKYGAPMGRSGNLRADLVGCKVHLRRVPLVDGCYDQGGAYWGGPNDLYCAWTDDGKEVYLRADSREEAKSHLPGCRFYR